MVSSSSSLPRPPAATRTASKCTPATERGTHVFTVDGYSLHKGLGAGNFINSTIFDVGGYDWCLYYFPDGKDSGDDVEDSIDLVLVTKGADVRVFYTIRLLNHDRAGMSRLVYSPTTKNSNSNTPASFTISNHDNVCKTSGAINLMKRKELEASTYLRDDRLVIECDLTVFKKPVVKEEEEAAMAGGDDITNIHQQTVFSDLSRDMTKMLVDKEGADVVFNVAGEVFPAHSVVLAARSPVFKAELYGPMRAQRGQQIVIQDMQPAVFRKLLHFMYNDSLSSEIDDLGRDNKMEMIKHLVGAADRYALEKLKTLCENSVSKSIGVDNVVNTFALADQHNCSRLKDACVQYITSSNRLVDMVASEGYGRLKSSCPAILVDIYERAAKGMLHRAINSSKGGICLMLGSVLFCTAIVCLVFKVLIF